MRRDMKKDAREIFANSSITTENLASSTVMREGFDNEPIMGEKGNNGHIGREDFTNSLPMPKEGCADVSVRYPSPYRKGRDKGTGDRTGPKARRDQNWRKQKSTSFRKGGTATHQVGRPSSRPGERKRRTLPRHKQPTREPSETEDPARERSDTRHTQPLDEGEGKQLRGH